MRGTALAERIGNLPAEEVHIHILRPEGGTFSRPGEALSSLLPPQERGRAAGFEREERRREFLWSRLLVRRALAFALGREMWNPDFAYGENGKPFLEDSEAHFNLSHTEGLLACSVAPRKVGIDVERVAPAEGDAWTRDLLARRFFSEAEKKFLFSQNPEHRGGFFYKIFTLKEAVLKASGSGLSRALDGFSVPLPLAEKAADGRWDYFTQFLEPGGFCLAHAVEATGRTPRYRFFEWTEASFEPPASFDGRD